MSKDELIELIQTLKLEELLMLKIVYYKDKNYGFSDNRTETILTINGEWLNG